jgi:hypothetical protein
MKLKLKSYNFKMILKGRKFAWDVCYSLNFCSLSSESNTLQINVTWKCLELHILNMFRCNAIEWAISVVNIFKTKYCVGFLKQHSQRVSVTGWKGKFSYSTKFKTVSIIFQETLWMGSLLMELVSHFLVHTCAELKEQ